MALGMNQDELEKYFEAEYIGTHTRRIKSERQRIENDLISHGIPKSEAKLLSLSDIQFISATQAVLRTILANNARIELQLREGGIRI